MNTDFYAFNEWLWRCDPGLAVKVQEWHDLWQNKRVPQQQPRHALSAITFSIDGRYRVVCQPEENGKPGGFALYSLEGDSALIAVYQATGTLFADLIAHSIRRTGHRSPEAFIPEAMRLLNVCRQEWAEMAGA